jgi:hypothetical protein
VLVSDPVCRYATLGYARGQHSGQDLDAQAWRTRGSARGEASDATAVGRYGLAREAGQSFCNQVSVVGVS